MELSTIKLRFPFSIGNKEIESAVETQIERKNSFISFSIPFKLELTIPRAINRTEKNSVYVFEFEELDDCLEWMNDKEVFVEQRRMNEDVHLLQKEMDEFMMSYEEREKKKKKRKMVDEDGFTYYE